MSVDIHITEEERKKSIYNPIYMGCSEDDHGHPVSVVKGRKGQLANKTLLDFNQGQKPPAVYQSAENIYTSVGYGLSNTTMIIGDDGIIIVDTNGSIESASVELAEFRKITDKPVVGVIYTHFHYVSGTKAYISERDAEKIPVIAHEKMPKELANSMSEVSVSYTERTYDHFGVFLPKEGEDATVSAGVVNSRSSKSETFTNGYIPPNTLIKTDEETEITISGIRFVFTTCPSDCEGSLIIWLPDQKTCINNHTWNIMPNLYTLRGEIYRDPRVWAAGLARIRDYHPEHLVCCHGVPISGEEQVFEAVQNQRDAIQFIFDQTVRYINKGLSSDEILQRVKLPWHLVSGPLTKPYYGEVSHYIRGVYRGLIGWFEVDTVEINHVTAEFEAKKIIQGFGGRDEVLRQAKESLEDRQYAWTAQLAGYLVTLDPDDQEARNVKAAALRKMGQVAPASSTRNFYLTQAEVLEGKLTKPENGGVEKYKYEAVPRRAAVKSLRTMIIPEQSEELEAILKITFSDSGESYGLAIRRGVGEDTEAPEHADAEIKGAYCDFLDILLKNKDIREEIKKGTFAVEDISGRWEEILAALDL